MCAFELYDIGMEIGVQRINADKENGGFKAFCFCFLIMNQ